MSIRIGEKNVEVRTTGAKPGKVAIYSSKYQYTKKEAADLIGHFYGLEENNLISMELCKFASDAVINGNRGEIMGTVEISSTFKVGNEKQYITYMTQHLAPASYFKEGNTVFWNLRNPVKFPEPIPLKKWPAGGPWARVPKSILPEVK